MNIDKKGRKDKGSNLDRYVMSWCQAGQSL